jgi:preprotein translocase subunit YajC
MQRNDRTLISGGFRTEVRNKQLLLSLTVMILMIVAIWFFAFRESKIEVDELALAVDNVTNVDRVEMESAKGKVTLHYDGTKWMVNGQYPADRRSIQLLFATVEGIKPQRPVSEKRRDEIKQQLQSQGTTVRFYVKDALVKTYVAGGNAQKPEAWFQVGDNDPMIVNIPGYRVYAAGVFEQTVNDWRDKRVFSMNWRNFKSLTTTFTKDPRETFTIAGKGRDFTVEGVTPVDTARVNTYLDDVSLLVGEGIYTMGQRPRIDSLLAGPTSFEVVVTDIGDRDFRLEVFPPMRNESSVFGRVNGEFMIFQRNEMARIAKKKSWFRANAE